MKSVNLSLPRRSQCNHKDLGRLIFPSVSRNKQFHKWLREKNNGLPNDICGDILKCIIPCYLIISKEEENRGNMLATI